MSGQGYFSRGCYHLSELDAKFYRTEKAGDDQTGHPSKIGVILRQAVLMDTTQWRTDRSDRTNGKRPNEQILIKPPISLRILLDDWDYQAFVLTISSQGRVFVNPASWIRQSTRHLKWQKRVNWSTWVPIAFWNFLTWCNDTLTANTFLLSNIEDSHTHHLFWWCRGPDRHFFKRR